MTQQDHRAGAAAPGMGRRMLLAAALLTLVGAGVWLSRRPPAAEAPVPAAVQAPASGPEAVDSVPVGSAPVAAASAVAPATSAPVVPAWVQQRASEAAAAALEKLRSPTEALRKVQIALAGGTPEEVLEAARTLQQCRMMAGGPDAVYAMRDRPDEMPPALKKMMDNVPGGINGLIKSSEEQARRCQVFDQATMGRRMELFQRAHAAGAEGAAAEYLMALQSPLEKQKPDPALVAKLQADVRAAAVAGDTGALQHLSLATGDQARELGVTPVQRDAYHAAWKTIMDERFPGITGIIEKATVPFMQPASAPALTGAEKAEANALAQQIVETWRRKRKGG